MTADARTLRTEIDAEIAAGNHERARALLGRLWRENPGAGLARYIESRFDTIAPQLDLVSCRLAILRSFTVEPLIPMLRAAAYAGGMRLEVRVCDFNAYAQEILRPDSALYAFAPDVVILAVRTLDVAPELRQGANALSEGRQDAIIDGVIDEVSALLTALRERSNASVVVHSFETPATPSLGILDAQLGDGQAEAIRRLNTRLAGELRGRSGMYLLDYDALVARYGRLGWADARKWLSVRLPLAAEHGIHLVEEWLRFLHPIAGRVCKALVVDLDNTLWGGVIGEDGIAGIALGEGDPGAFYLELQQAILDLSHRGILLAIASKNNEVDAITALAEHPAMLLKPEQFAALRINWNDKATSIREIAAELNIGLDAIAFLDDNPVEREWVRRQLPMVTVIELPPDPLLFAQTLRGTPMFERLSLSAEDRERGRYYAEQRSRTTLAEQAGSLEDFYRSLAMEIEIEHVTEATQLRVAQLTQKTNQFNLTTRRRSEQEIAALAAGREATVYTARVRDRFGDNGLVGVAIVHCRGDECEIDTLLLSCRVMGRTVETAFLATIAEEARDAGHRTLSGWYRPTAKNAVVEDLYRSHGFIAAEETATGVRWSLDLTTADLRTPPWIVRHLKLAHFV